MADTEDDPILTLIDSCISVLNKRTKRFSLGQEKVTKVDEFNELSRLLEESSVAINLLMCAKSVISHFTTLDIAVEVNGRNKSSKKNAT